MRNLWYAVLLVLLPSVGHAEVPDFVSLRYELSEGSVLVTLNGFPVVNLSTSTRRTGSGPANLHLVPTGNQVDIEYAPATDESTFRLTLLGSDAGAMAGADDPGDLLQITLPAADGESSRAMTFDLPEAWRQRYTAGLLYREGQVIANREAVRAYGLHLLDLVAAAEFEAFATEMLPAYVAQRKVAPSIGVPEDNATVVELVAQSWRGQFQGDTLRMPGGSSELALTSWAGGRVFEISWSDGSPLISATFDDGSLEMSVFVALIDGELKVVRTGL